MNRRVNKPYTVLLAVLGLCFVFALPPAGAQSPVRAGASLFTQAGSNPAVLGVDEPTFRIVLSPLELSGENNAWSLAALARAVDSGFTGDVKDELAAVLPEDGLFFRAATWTAADLGVRAFSARLAVRTAGTGRVAPDFLELALRGYEPGCTYGIDGTHGAVAAFGDASAGFALDLGNRVRIGVRYHYLVGAAYMDVAASGRASVIDVDGFPSFDGELRVDLRRTTGEGIRGYGHAYDLGVLIQPTANLSLGLAVLDVGALQWEGVVKETYRVKLGEELAFEKIGASEPQTLEWRLPTTYQVSAGYRLTPALRLGAAYSRTVSPGAGADAATADRVEAMVNWTGLGVLPVGIGAAYDAENGLSIAGEAALKLGPLQTRLRLTDVQALFNGGDVKTLGFLFDFGFVF